MGALRSGESGAVADLSDNGIVGGGENELLTKLKMNLSRLQV